MNAGYLVWIEGPKGPVPQRWADRPSGADGYWKSRTVAVHELTADDELLSINELAAKFPAPKVDAS